MPVVFSRAMADPTPTPPPARKPMSMLWVLAAIGCFVVIHTVVNIAYRKPERPHEPAVEARERERHFVRGDLKGWQRFAARLGRPDGSGQSTRQPAHISREPAPENLAATLPFNLVGIFNTDPRLHPAPGKVQASSALPVDQALGIMLNFESAQKPVAFGEPLAFAKDNHLYLFLQDDTRTVPDGPPTAFAPELEFTLPPHALSVGNWQVSLYTKDAAFSWQFVVTDATAP